MKRDEFLLSITDAARLLGIAPGTLRHHADSGRVPCVRSSNRGRLFRTADIEAERERRHQAEQEARRAR